MMRGNVLNEYVQLAKNLGMINAKIIRSDAIHFDSRTLLKCKWGCDDPDTVKCSDRDIPYEMRIQIVKSYQHILLLHSDDVHKLYSAGLKIERQAFLDGHRYAFLISPCYFCPSCEVANGNPCVAREKIRPCDSLFGIDVYKTVREQDLPCDILKDKNQPQNRYAFLLLE